MAEARLAPPFSVVFVSDPAHPADVPQDLGGSSIAATDSCVAIGTLAEMDGETTFRLLGLSEQAEGSLAFDGVIATPGRQLAITDAEGDVILAKPVGSQRTRIQVWTNDSNEPDLVTVLGD